ncbi:hypothetical protein FRC03_007122 [Tulasnella sp. 419]|nr:hypothetical protein FRC03_007122 [Tulasnella sp. 419]
MLSFVKPHSDSFSYLNASPYRSRINFTFKAADYGVRPIASSHSPFSPPNSRPPSPVYSKFICSSRYKCGICSANFGSDELKSYVAHVKEHAHSSCDHEFQSDTQTILLP